MIEDDVKKILDGHFEETTDTAKDPCLRDIAQQICHLFPKTEENPGGVDPNDWFATRGLLKPQANQDPKPDDIAPPMRVIGLETDNIREPKPDEGGEKDE